MANSQACGSLIFNNNLLTSTDNCNGTSCLLSTSDPINQQQQQQQQLQSQQQQQQCSVSSNNSGENQNSSSTNLPQLFKAHSHYHPTPPLPPPPHQPHHHHSQSQQQQTNCILYSNSNNFRTHNSHLSNSTLSLNDSSGSVKGHNNSSSLNLSPIGSPLPVGICGSPSCNGHLCLTNSCGSSGSGNSNSPASPLSATSKEQLRQLFEACKIGDIGKVKLLANTRNVNARDTCIGNSLRKSTCLHFASGESWSALK